MTALKRGSLDRAGKCHPPPKKPNNRPLNQQMRRWYEQEAFTGWSCIKQTSPPQIFMGRDLLINLLLSSISQFCISQEFGAGTGNHVFLHLCTCSRILDPVMAPKQKCGNLYFLPGRFAHVSCPAEGHCQFCYHCCSCITSSCIDHSYIAYVN